MEPNTSLRHWVADYFETSAEQLDWQPLLGDASFRSYTRLSWLGKSYIAAYAPPATEKNHEFVAIAQLLEKANVSAPKILAVDYQQGFILQSDLGSVDLQAVLNTQTVDAYYQQAMQLIAQIQTVSCQDLPVYDCDLLQLELSLFQQWFVTELLDYSCSEEEQAMLNTSFDYLLQSALEQPQAFVHRDFHCRNILVTEQGLACIDFQDAVSGPVTYDLVSLLRDCYVVWSESEVNAWLDSFRSQHFPTIDAEQFQRWFDLMGLQRHIKVLGIFARLFVRDGKDRYLSDLPTVIQYTLSVAQRYPELAEFCTWFNVKLMPLIKQQTWSKSV